MRNKGIIINIIVLAISATISIIIACCLYNANNKNSSNKSSDNIKVKENDLYASTSYSQLNPTVNYLETQTPTKLTLTINKGTLDVDQSFTMGKAIFINLKLKSFNISANTATVAATIPSYSAGSETACLVSFDSGSPRVLGHCVIKTNGQISVESSFAFSSADVRIVAMLMK